MTIEKRGRDWLKFYEKWRKFYLQQDYHPQEVIDDG